MPERIDASTLTDFMGLVAKNTLKYVTDKAMDCLHKHLINDVYAYDYYPNKEYTPEGSNKYPITPKSSSVRGKGDKYSTFEFYDAFKIGEIEKLTKKYTQNLYYDWEDMSVKPRIYRASSDDAIPSVHYDDDSGTDIRKELFELLNVKGYFANKERNQYWDNFLKELQRSVKKWATEYLNDMGINFKIK